ncbi:MAG: CoA transferase, partial [Myxococcales bacterium]|nr:CoA transferase [Myxococcales bacterium]
MSSPTEGVAQAPLTASSPCLEGIRVLDLTRILSGPYCTAILGDHGADVIKVESPAGDDTRRFGPPFVDGEATYFLSINRNKRSVIIDLKTEEGRAKLHALAKTADVVVENFRPGTAERIGAGPETLRAINPKLVYCHISGFGQTGPWSKQPGYDLAVQGLSGLQALTGKPEGEPTKLGVSIADLVTGLYASQAILLALFRRERTGEGEVVDVAMLDSVVSLLSFQAGRYLGAGMKPRRMGNQHPSIAPYETFETADGWLNLAVGNDKLWVLACGVMGLQSLANDERFARNPDRVAHRELLLAELVPVLKSRTRDEWVTAFRQAGVPCGEILEVEEILEHEVVKARD